MELMVSLNTDTIAKACLGFLAWIEEVVDADGSSFE
jgi:hypothetical protein